MVTVLLTRNSVKWLIFICELQNKYLTQNTVKASVHTGRTLQSVAVNHQVLEKKELWPEVENKDHRFVGIILFLLNPLNFSADQLPPSSRSSIRNTTVEPLQLSRDDPFKAWNTYCPVTNCNQPIHANTKTCKLPDAKTSLIPYIPMLRHQDNMKNYNYISRVQSVTMKALA